nr:hypothetical protein [Virgisporangium ochraceum]
MPTGYQTRSTASNRTPSTSRAATLRAARSAGTPVSWKHSIAQHQARARPPATTGDQRGRTNSAPA